MNRPDSTRSTHRARLSWSLLVVPLLVLDVPVPAAPPSRGAAATAADASTAGRAEFAYGPEPLQTLDFWRADATGPAPLVVFVHGGGWTRGDKRNATGTAKVEHLTGEGYAVASLDYRLVPTATVEQQAGDVAMAIAWLRDNAGRLGIDGSRIVLMGHSAGAHLVALVGTDPRYLAASGLSWSNLRGVIALDGAAYDVPRQMVDAGPLMRGTYRDAFGSGPARQGALSPALQPLTADGPAFLILHIDRADGTTQSEMLARALTKAGRSAQVVGVDGSGVTGHMEINRSLGTAAYPATAVVDEWLRQRFDPR